MSQAEVAVSSYGVQGEQASIKEWTMDLALWIVAGLLAAVALAGGVTKTFVPKETLAAAHGGDGPPTSASPSSRRSVSWNCWPRQV